MLLLKDLLSTLLNYAKVLASLSAILICEGLIAQSTYVPSVSNAEHEVKLIKKCGESVEEQLMLYRGNKDFKNFISERQSALEYYIQRKQYLFDDFFYQKSRTILNKLVNTDTIYKNHVKDILIGRSFVPNAYCYGNGILVINLGLISRFENDDQMAFVIGHELAHQLLDHVDTKIKKLIDYQNSKEYKKELRKIKSNQYNQFSRFENFMLKQELNSRSYSRKRERQADSMAVVLMKNAGYNANAALETMDILDRSDQPIYNDTINFIEHLSCTNFQFKEKWLRKNNGLRVEQKMRQELIDSLKTHPDCKDRAQRLKNIFKLDFNESKNYDSTYTDIQFKALMENIQYSLHIKRYGLALSESLQLLNHFPDNRYLQSTIGICLAEIYFAQKNHKLREYVPRPSDDYTYNYHQSLLMIENMRLSELKELALSHMEKQRGLWKKQTIESEQHLIYHQYLYSKIKGDTAVNHFKNIYLEQFPGGYFTYSFN